MHWLLKVTLTLICLEIYSITSRPIPRLPYPDLRRTYNSLSYVNPNVRNRTPLERGLNVGIDVKFPKTTTTKKYDDTNLEKLERILYKAISDEIVDRGNSTSDCASCDEEDAPPKRHTLKPAYECDAWDPKRRICILERNLGDTVTFYLSTGKAGVDHQQNVTWKKEFHSRKLRDSNPVEYVIDSENPPENIIIGRRGYELRISPIAETDLEYNLFSATLQSHSESPMSKLSFMIRIVPNDLGFVYVGETIELNLRQFVSIPEQSMSFEWYMERDGEHGTLPSNMKVSSSGSSLKVFELRQDQEGILACSVYTNLNILATKRRFLIKDLVKNKDVLQSSPNHTLIFKEALRLRRDRQRPTVSHKISRHVRETDLAADIEQEPIEPTTTENETPRYTTFIYKEASRHRRDRQRPTIFRKISRHVRETNLLTDIKHAFKELTTTGNEVPLYTTLVYKEYLRHRRDRQRATSSRKISRRIRETDLIEDIEQALREPTTTEKEIPLYTTTEITTHYADYNLDKEGEYQNLEQAQPYEEDENRFQEDKNIHDVVGEGPEFQQMDVSNRRKPDQEFVGSEEEQRKPIEKAKESQFLRYNHVPLSQESQFQTNFQQMGALNEPKPMLEFEGSDEEPKRPMEKEEIIQYQPNNHVPLNQEMSFQTVDSLNDINMPLSGYPENKKIEPHRYPANKIPFEYLPETPEPQIAPEMQANHPLPFTNEHRQKIPQKHRNKPHSDVIEYEESNIQSKNHLPNQKDSYSDTVLNIDRLAELRQTIAEDKIAELISNCFSDFDCSIRATCVRNSLKTPGYCKCLPGFNGVGIFCREAVWLSNNNFDLHDSFNNERDPSMYKQ